MNTGKQTPFNQHRPEVPTGAKIEKWYRRNIIVSHPDMKIYIQIMFDGYGTLKLSEYHEIKKGAWFGLVPPEMITTIREGLASGYTICPMALAGGPVGEEHTALQIIEITDGHHMITGETMTRAIESN